MEDIEAVLKEARRLRFGEDRAGYILNRISDLPEAKSRMKLALKERIRELVGAYIALASFIPDWSVKSEPSTHSTYQQIDSETL